MEDLITAMETLRDIIPRWKDKSTLEPLREHTYWVKAEKPMKVYLKIGGGRQYWEYIWEGAEYKCPEYEYWLPYDILKPISPNGVIKGNISSLNRQLLEDIQEVCKVPKWIKKSEETPNSNLTGDRIWVWSYRFGVQKAIYNYDTIYDKMRLQNYNSYYTYNPEYVEDVEYWMPYMSMLECIQYKK